MNTIALTKDNELIINNTGFKLLADEDAILQTAKNNCLLLKDEALTVEYGVPWRQIENDPAQSSIIIALKEACSRVDGIVNAKNFSFEKSGGRLTISFVIELKTGNKYEVRI